MTLTRRAVLGGIATTAAMAAGRWEPAQARPPRHSANGWPLIARPPASRVEGADLSITLAPGPAAAVLLHFLRRFLYEVDHAVPQSELVSHLPRPAGPARYETNHLSGTAIAIRPTWYPSGVAAWLRPLRHHPDPRHPRRLRRPRTLGSRRRPRQRVPLPDRRTTCRSPPTSARAET